MVIEKDINEQNDLALSEQEVWDVIKFARSISGMQGMTYLNPDLVSGRMKDISLNPMQATQDMLDRAMREPKNSEPQIQAFSQTFELSSMVYKKMIAYLANMLVFDVTYTSNAELSDYSTPRYKRDLKTVEDFLDEFYFKQEFKIVIREMLRNDAYFGCIRNTESGYVLQELPSEYCKITGRWSGGFLLVLICIGFYYRVSILICIQISSKGNIRKFGKILIYGNHTNGLREPKRTT